MLMNTKLTAKALEPVRKLSVSHKAIRSFATPLAALLLCASSTAVFANRPAMEESGSVSSQPVYQQEQATDDHRPSAAAETDAPSAVELMMQQQTRKQYSGDVLQLPAKEIQPGETVKIKLLDYPRRGMTMDRVQNEYGQPIAISDSVGKPPITRWTYNDRIVFFEHSTVLHVVPR